MLTFFQINLRFQTVYITIPGEFYSKIHKKKAGTIKEALPKRAPKENKRKKVCKHATPYRSIKLHILSYVEEGI